RSPLVALAHVASGESADPSVTLGFMALSPLVAALFLPMRGVLVLGIVNLCGIALLPVLAAQTSPPLSSLLGTSTSNSIATALALLYIHHRNLLERERQRSLLANERRLRLALEGADMGHWEFDLQTGRSSISSRVERMFGIPPGSWGGDEQALYQVVHPDDLGMVRDLVARMQTGESTLSA